MPVIRLEEMPEIAQTGPGLDTIIMKKVIGSSKSDPSFTGPDDTSSLSITHVRVWGQLRRTICNESDRVLFIVEGGGVALVGYEPPQGFKSGDFILIPKGTPYECEGDFTYLVINSPAYREGTEFPA